MAVITLVFNTNQINASVQIGDTAYYSTPESSGGYSFEDSDSGITTIGIIKSMSLNSATNMYSVEINIDDETDPPSAGDYVFFSKDRAVNISSVKGYYGEVKFINNSKDKAELFSTACEIFESSK